MGVEMLSGAGGFPYLKIQMLPSCHFMFFDRYEIQIHDFGDFIYITTFHYFPVPIFTQLDQNEIHAHSHFSIPNLQLPSFQIVNVSIANFPSYKLSVNVQFPNFQYVKLSSFQISGVQTSKYQFTHFQYSKI